jgi:hypothetical protein
LLAWHAFPDATLGTQIELAVRQNDWPAVHRFASQSASVWQSAVQNFGDVSVAPLHFTFSPTHWSSAVQGRPK